MFFKDQRQPVLMVNQGSPWRSRTSGNLIGHPCTDVIRFR